MAATQETLLEKYKKVKRLKWLVGLFSGSTGIAIFAAVMVIFIIGAAILGGGTSSTGTSSGGISGYCIGTKFTTRSHALERDGRNRMCSSRST